MHCRDDTRQATPSRLTVSASTYSSVFRSGKIVPDQNGNLRTIREISYPPEALIRDRLMNLAPFEQWAAYPGRPVDWLHHRALGRERLSRIDRLFHQEGEPRKRGMASMRRATIAQWLEALVENQKPDDAVQASIAAIRTAALISPQIRSNNNLGAIVLAASGDWRVADPESVFLPDELLNERSPLSLGSFVHPKVASDGDTRKALATLGIKPVSPKESLRTGPEATDDWTQRTGSGCF